MKNATDLLKFIITGFFLKFDVVAAIMIKTTSRKNLIFFKSKYSQATALKVACIFKLFRAQSYLTLAYSFDQVNKF